MSEPYRYFDVTGGGLTQEQADERYPAGDPSSGEDGYVWTKDVASGGYLPKPANAHSHGVATQEEAGLQSAEDKEKQDRALDVETEQRVVYVSPNGIDSGSGSSSAPWRTVQYAANQARTLMEPRNGASAYNIICANGLYEEPPAIIKPNVFAAFNSAGRGGIWIISDSGVASDVVLRFPGGLAGITSQGPMSLELITVEHDEIQVLVQGSAANTASVNGCDLRRVSESNGGRAHIFAQYALVSSQFNSSPAGRLCEYGLLAGRGAVIAKRGSQPSGYAAGEFVDSGGVIS